MAYELGVDLNLAVERSYPTPLQNSTLLPLLLLSLARQKNSPDTAQSIKNEYDYIVVGAGSAGSVVAARLSEIPCVSVLLLEAGPPPPRLNDVPSFGRNFWLTDVDWQYKTAPQKHTGRGLRNRQLSWPSGKALGGSSILNNGVYVRGNRKDYNDWAAMGAKGWSYDEVLPYFKKMEDNRDYDYVSNGYHGVGGPVTVMRASYDPEIQGAVFRAAGEMGYRVVDPNARRQTGFYDPQINLRDNQRCSTAKAYLVPAGGRPNLDILPHAMVKKIIIKGRRATGVLFSYKDRNYKVRAKREVIMSAGSINTAQLLMLSGIGPKEELQRLNIPVHADLPVGQNLQDHAGTTVEFVLSPYIAQYIEKVSDPANVKRYIYNRTGPLCSPEGISNIAFLYNDEVNPRHDYPNYEMYFGEGGTTIPRDQWNMKPEVYQQVYAPYENLPLMVCIVQQLHPRSRGSVTLKSASPYDEPIIDPNYLEDPRDVDDLVEGMKICKRLGTSQTMGKLGSQMFETLFPGCEKYALDEERYFRCVVRTVIHTLSHPVGTAKMGDPRDPTTVVDPTLRVKHIKGLRVVDNSIMPQIVSGNTGIPAIMIGEKASDIIKESIHCHKPEHSYDHDYYAPEENTSIESEDYDVPNQNPSFVDSGDTSEIHPSFESDEYNISDVNPSFIESDNYDDDNRDIESEDYDDGKRYTPVPHFKEKLNDDDDIRNTLPYSEDTTEDYDRTHGYPTIPEYKNTNSYQKRSNKLPTADDNIYFHEDYDKKQEYNATHRGINRNHWNKENPRISQDINKSNYGRMIPIIPFIQKSPSDIPVDVTISPYTQIEYDYLAETLSSIDVPKGLRKEIEPKFLKELIRVRNGHANLSPRLQPRLLIERRQNPYFTLGRK